MSTDPSKHLSNFGRRRVEQLKRQPAESRGTTASAWRYHAARAFDQLAMLATVGWFGALLGGAAEIALKWPPGWRVVATALAYLVALALLESTFTWLSEHVRNDPSVMDDD